MVPFLETAFMFPFLSKAAGTYPWTRRRPEMVGPRPPKIQGIQLKGTCSGTYGMGYRVLQPLLVLLHRVPLVQLHSTTARKADQSAWLPSRSLHQKISRIVHPKIASQLLNCCLLSNSSQLNLCVCVLMCTQVRPSTQARHAEQKGTPDSDGGCVCVFVRQPCHAGLGGPTVRTM